MMFQVMAEGGVMPSYDIETRVDRTDFDQEFIDGCFATLIILITYFMFVEFFEIRREKLKYFTNMWNLMDWTGFLVFFQCAAKP